MSRILIDSESPQIFAEELLIAEQLNERMKGLLGRRSLAPESALLIRPCRSIHMWFMHFPIDAAFLDADLRVLKISRGLRPWQLAIAPGGTHCVLETATGVLDGIAVDERLRLK